MYWAQKRVGLTSFLLMSTLFQKVATFKTMHIIIPILSSVNTLLHVREIQQLDLGLSTLRIMTYHTSKLTLMLVNGEALQLHAVFKKLYFY